MNIETQIEGANLLVERFGFWPSFEDAEVIALKFERGNHMQVVERGAWAERLGESLAATFLVFDARHALISPARKPTEAVIRFEPLTSFKMSGFNYQNPILGLNISPHDLLQDKSKFLVQWGGTAMHHEVSFNCERICVLSAKPVAV